MKIKKEFIPLILSGEKKYEFRNSNDKEGIYEIEGIWFLLIREWNYSTTFSLAKNYYNTSVEIYFCGHHITHEEYEWLENNREYFIDNEVWVYKWFEIKNNKVEKLEGVSHE